MIDDIEAWNQCHEADRWTFNKLEVARRLGYICGPRGMNVPKSNKYVVRPCLNFTGMGLGAKIIHLKDKTDHKMEPGTFWCEILRGEHLSVDFYKKRPHLVVKGTRHPKRLDRWLQWEKVDRTIPFPTILDQLHGDYDWINIEMIGGKIIEIHLRPSCDFSGHDSPYVRPVWKEHRYLLKHMIKPGERFIKDAEDDRLGFIIKAV